LRYRLVLFHFICDSVLYQNKRVVVGGPGTESTRGADPAVTVQGVVGAEGSVFTKVVLFLISFCCYILFADRLWR